MVYKFCLQQIVLFLKLYFLVWQSHFAVFKNYNDAGHVVQFFTTVWTQSVFSDCVIERPQPRIWPQSAMFRSHFDQPVKYVCQCWSLFNHVVTSYQLNFIWMWSWFRQCEAYINLSLNVALKSSCLLALLMICSFFEQYWSNSVYATRSVIFKLFLQVGWDIKGYVSLCFQSVM